MTDARVILRRPLTMRPLLLLTLLGTAAVWAQAQDTTSKPEPSGRVANVRLFDEAPGGAPLKATQPWDYKVDAPSRSACGPDQGKTFEVGPGKPYPTPKDVPWVGLGPCDQVLISYRPEPYNDIVFLSARGDKDRWITIRGLPGPKGERPVFDGNDAVTPTSTGFNKYYDGQGLFVIGRPGTGRTTSYGYKPGYLHITGLHIRNVRPPAKFTGLDGVVRGWSGFTSAIYANPVEDLAITNCELADNGLGLFINSLFDEAQQSRRILVSGNYFHGNGMAGRADIHNAYTEAVGTVYEYNYFGPPAAGTAGDNIKERSAGVIFRYNYIEGGVHSISLRDPQSNGPYEAAQFDTFGDPLVKHAFVYGNFFMMRGQDENNGMMIGHGDGAYGDGRQLRWGNLFFYGNTVVAQYDQQPYVREAVTLFQLINERAPTTVHAVNNLFYVSARTKGKTAPPFSLFLWQGKAAFAGNWINKFVPTFPNAKRSGGLFVGEKFNGEGLGGLRESSDPPGFANAAAGDWRPGPGWPTRVLSAPWPPEAVQRGLVPTARPVMAPFAAPQSLTP